MGCRSGAIDWHGVFLDLLGRRAHSRTAVKMPSPYFAVFLAQTVSPVTVTFGQNSTVRYGTPGLNVAIRAACHHKCAIFAARPLFLRRVLKHICAAAV
ncbi:hypothetical protein AGR1C_Cc40438 [Agrobacterium fabacearum TT111]|nr:hypothetical protein AGR1C_Cc40438 [Agrobacterium fabacearum TT111]